MPKLTGKKRKQKLSINSRGNHCTQDANKFGQKVLEKIGWSKGKVSSTKLNQTTEHIRTPNKNEITEDVGVKCRDTVLSHKYAKKVSEDLDESDNNSKKNSYKNTVNENHWVKQEEDEPKVETKQSDFVRETSNRRSMMGYFNKKLKNVCKKKENNQSNGVRNSESESLGKLSDEESNENVASRRITIKNQTPTKHKLMLDEITPCYEKKGKRKACDFEAKGINNPVFDPFHDNTKVQKHILTPINEDESETDDIISEIRDAASGFHISSKVDVTDEISLEEEMHCNNITSSTKKKRGNIDNTFQHVQEHLDFTQAEYSETNENQTNDSLSTSNSLSDVDISKNNKPKEKTCFEISGIDNLPSFNDSIRNKSIAPECSIRSIDCSYDSCNKKLKKKRKTKDNHSIDAISLDSVSESFEVKRKNKKRKLESGIDNPCVDSSNSVDFNSNNDDTDISNRNASFYGSFEVKPKAKKSKKPRENGFDNPCVDLNDFSNSHSNNDEASVTSKNASLYDTFEVKAKIKKHEKSKETGFDNPNIDLDDSFSSNSNINVNVAYVRNASVYETFREKKKVKKHKKIKENGIINPSLKLDDSDISYNLTEFCVDTTSQETKNVQKSKEKKVRYQISGQDNLDNQNIINSNSRSIPMNVEGVDLDEKISKKKKKKYIHEAFYNGIDNPCLNLNALDDRQDSVDEKISTISVNGIDNPCLNLNSSNEELMEESTNATKELSVNPIEEIVCDFIINEAAAPVPENRLEPPRGKRVIQRRKSVRFSEMNEERIIPSNHKHALITPSKAFDSNNIDENVNMISEAIDKCQAEVENDMNEAKLNQWENMVSEIADANGENEFLSTGETKLKLKHAKFGRILPWQISDINYAKKAYKHLIKGDIVLGFKDTNLHEVEGYSVQ